MMLQRFIVLAVGIMVLCGCDNFAPDVEAIFVLKNNTNRRLSFVVGKHYPDTLISPDNPIRTMDARASINVGVGERDMERFFESLPRDTVSIFFLEADTVKKYPLEKINEEYMILTRRDLSYWDLVNNDSQVSYP